MLNVIAPKLLLGMMALSIPHVAAQTFPSKPIRIMTGAAGGSTDTISRIVAGGISPTLGQPVIVDNRPSNIVAGLVAKAPPDGYTLLITGSELWRSPLLQKMPYDVGTDFIPVTTLLRPSQLLAVHPSLPVKSVRDLIALAKARPGELNYASGPTGTPTHLASELLKSMAGINIVRVTYNSSSQSIIDLIAGQVQVSFHNPSDVMPQVAVGKMRALAISSLRESPVLPGIPTIAASGLPNFQSESVIGLWVPAKTPSTIIQRLNAETARVITQPNVREQYMNRGLEPPIGSSPEEFANVVRDDSTRIAKLVKDLGLSPN